MNILEKLINNGNNFVNIYQCEMKQSHYIYRYQKPCDYFVLLIEGSFIVESGQEKIESFAKQFDSFGIKSLIGKKNLNRCNLLVAKKNERFNCNISRELYKYKKKLN